MATKNTIKDIPIVSRDIHLAKVILGPSVYDIKGKQKFHFEDPAQTPGQVPLPQSIEVHYKNLTIADVLHVDQIPMLTTISSGIHCSTVAPLPNMKTKTLETTILAVV